MNETETTILQEILTQLKALNKKHEKKLDPDYPDYVPPEDLVVCKKVKVYHTDIVNTKRMVSYQYVPVNNPEAYEIVRKEHSDCKKETPTDLINLYIAMNDNFIR